MKRVYGIILIQIVEMLEDNGKISSENGDEEATEDICDEKTVNVTCNLCDYVGRTPDNLTNHIKSVHAKKANVSHKCDRCGFRTPVKSNLNKHIEVIVNQR